MTLLSPMVFTRLSGRSRWFKPLSTFDLTSGYFQIPLKEEDIRKSSFVCKYGQLEMTKVPFGLNNLASTFQ